MTSYANKALWCLHACMISVRVDHQLSSVLLWQNAETTAANWKKKLSTCNLDLPWNPISVSRAEAGVPQSITVESLHGKLWKIWLIRDALLLLCLFATSFNLSQSPHFNLWNEKRQILGSCQFPFSVKLREH